MRKRTGPRRATLAQVPTVAPQLPTPRPEGPGDRAHRASFTAVRSPSSRALRCSLSRSSELAASALRSDSAAWAPASLTAASSLLSCCTWGGEKASKRGCNGNAGGGRGPPCHLIGTGVFPRAGLVEAGTASPGARGRPAPQASPPPPAAPPDRTAHQASEHGATPCGPRRLALRNPKWPDEGPCAQPAPRPEPGGGGGGRPGASAGLGLRAGWAPAHRAARMLPLA